MFGLQVTTLISSLGLLSLVMSASIGVLQVGVSLRNAHALAVMEPQVRAAIIDDVNATLQTTYRSDTPLPAISTSIPACAVVQSSGFCANTIAITGTVQGSPTVDAASTQTLANVNGATEVVAPDAPNLLADPSTWTTTATVAEGAYGPGSTPGFEATGTGATTGEAEVATAPALTLVPGDSYALSAWVSTGGWSGTTATLLDVVDATGATITSITAQPTGGGTVMTAPFACCTGTQPYTVRVHDPEETTALPAGTVVTVGEIALRQTPSAGTPLALQQHAVYGYTMTLTGPGGKAIATRSGALGLTIVSGTAYADAIQSRVGNTLGNYDRASITGSCDSTDASCDPTGQATPQPGATMSDTRIHAYARCTATSGSSCAPTGAGAAGATKIDDFHATAAPDGENSGTWAPR